MSDNLQVTVMELLLEDITDSESLSTINDDLEKAILRREETIKKQQEQLEVIKRFKGKVLNKLRLILSQDETEGATNE